MRPMTRIPTKLTAVGTACVVLGAGAGTLLNAEAAPKAATATEAAKAKKAQKQAPAAKALRRAVHAELTVPGKDGFETVTVDRGTLTAVNGSQLTIDESTKKLKGKTVTVTVPSTVKVRSDGKAATLAGLKPGQKVAVMQLPKRTVVRAHTPKK